MPFIYLSQNRFNRMAAFPLARSNVEKTIWEWFLDEFQAGAAFDQFWKGANKVNIALAIYSCIRCVPGGYVLLIVVIKI